MTIVGHHPVEEAGNNTILVTLILHHILPIMPEARNRLDFHLRHLRPMPANPTANTSTTSKDLHSTTMAQLHITTARLHINQMAVTHREEAFEGLQLPTTSVLRL